MANTSVTKVSELLLTNVTAGVKAGDQKVSDGSGFSEVMDIAKDNTAKVQPVKGDDVTKTRTVVETPKSKEIKAEDKTVRDPMASEADKAEFTEEVADKASKIFDKIKEVLDVSDEDIKNAMETLGITAVDLLDPVSIKDLCMELTGLTDSISLITNAEVYDSVKEIVLAAEDAVATIAAQFGMTEENTESVFKDESIIDAVKENFSDLRNKSEASALQQNEAVVPTDGIETIQMPNSDKDVATQAEAPATAENHIETDVHTAVRTDEAATADTDAKTVTVEVKGTPQERPAETRPAAETAQVKTGDTLETASTGKTETFKAPEKTEESSLKGESEPAEQMSRFAQLETETVQAAAPQQTTVVETEVNNLGQVVETVTTYSNADASSIMSQVTESIRVSYTPDTTSMELQLHPASLGTVNMHIASTNGVITAQIIVQSEAVKAALESQLITLQQTFDEAGSKVEAVEVTVANYDLNKGTGSETGSNSEEQNHARAGRVGTRRRINLSDLSDEDIEELDEEEKLSADMMARSGNTMDYRA